MVATLSGDVDPRGLQDVPAALIRPLEATDIRCPAGTLVGDDGCLCAIERGVIVGRRNPTSIEAFCLGEFETCPTWRAEKERVWAHQDVELADRRPAHARDARARVAERRARMERARELMTSPTEDGRRFRARLQRIIDPAQNPFLRHDSTPGEKARAVTEMARG